MAARTDGPRDIVLAHETLSELVARGYSEADAIEAIAFGVFLRRTEAMVEPVEADHEYARGTNAGRAYLEKVAPEELER